jgi:hypothetical protein
VSGVVLGPLAAVCVVAHSGVGEGGIAGAAHSVPPGVRSHVGDGEGGIAGAAHNVPPGVRSGDCLVGCSVAAVAVVSFVRVGVGWASGAAVRADAFASSTSSLQSTSSGRLSSGLPWFAM